MNKNIKPIRARAGLGCSGFLAAGCLCGSAAVAADGSDLPSTAELTTNKSNIEAGVGDVTQSSYKFGEYNGLQNRGLFGNGSLDIVSGTAFDSPDGTRWRLRGSDLGLDTRSAAAEYGVQGRFRATLGYDQLRHDISDSYSTPYVGVGVSVLTLPSTWVVPLVPRVSATSPNARGLSGDVDNSSALVTGVLKAPTPAQLATSAAIIGADLPLFGEHDLYTTRQRFDAGFSYLATSKWEFAFGAKHEDRTGTKPMGTVSAQTGGDIATILADPIDQTTDQFNATLGYHDKSRYLQVAYNGSLFKNHIDSLTWTNWALPTATDTVSSAPSNQSHQLSVGGRYDLSTTTRLVGSAAYTRNTQNDSFITDASTPLVPVSSLNGLVVTEALNLKVTSRPMKALDLALAYKFDVHDNKTPVHIYAFYDANGVPAATNINSAFSTALGVPAALLKSNVNVNETRPYSRRLDQVVADADLKLTPTETVKGEYSFQRTHRWCNGTWIDCMDADVTTEHSMNLELRSNPVASLNTSVGYLYSKRAVDTWNANAFLAIVPMANVSPTGALDGASAYSFLMQNGFTGYGPVAGYAATTGNMNLFFPLNNALSNAQYQNQNRINEILGLLRYNLAPRERNRLRGNADWQATEKFDAQAHLDYRVDHYADSTYGLLADRDLVATLEFGYTPLESLAITLFYTYEDQHSNSAGNSYTANSAATSVNGATAISGGCFATIALRSASNKVDPCLNWEADMHNQTNALGFDLDKKGLMHARLDLGVQFTVSRATDGNDVTGGNYVNNPLAVTGAPVGTVAAYYIPATSLPAVITNVFEGRFSARYALNDWTSIRLTYLYADMHSDDYAYRGLQFGGLSGVLPTGQRPPAYAVHVVYIAYSARF